MKTKKLNQRIVLAMGVAVMLFSACAKDELDTNTAEVPYGPKKQIGVSAQIITGTPDKAYMDIASYKVMWESGDQLTVNNGTLTMTELDSDDPTHAKFNGSASPNTALESGKDVYRSVFPASIISSIPNTNSPMVVTLPATQTFANGSSKVENNFMAAYTSVPTGSDVNDMVFRYKNLCSVVKLIITPQSGATGVDAQISRIRLASTEGLSGNFNVTFSNGEPVLTSTDPTPSKIVELVYTTPLTLSGSTPVTVYAVVPPMTNKSLVMQIWNGDGSKIIQKQANSLTLGRSRVHAATINQAFEDWGGAISVSNSQKVYFAGGNLQHNFAQNKWRFAHEQYSLIPDAARNYTVYSIYGTADGYAEFEAKYTDLRGRDIWTDLFGWGTSGDNRSGALNYAPYCVVWSYNATSLAGWGSKQYGFGYGPVGTDYVVRSFSGTGEAYFGQCWDWTNCDPVSHIPASTGSGQTLQSLYADWGYVHNTELNATITDPTKRAGTAVGQTWRTLSSAEWEYAYEGAKRIEIDGKLKCGMGRIDTTGHGDYACGLFLLPDRMHYYLMPAGLTFTPGVANRFETNTFTYAQFKLLESYGVVFLPACGARTNSIHHTNEIGFYWSSSSNTNIISYDGVTLTHAAEHAYSFRINGLTGVPENQRLTSVYTENKFDGNGVRLVRNTTDQ